MSARNVVLTGGTGKMGKFIAQSLAEKGNNIALVVRNLNKGDLLASQLMATYPSINVEVFHADLSKNKDMKTLIKDLNSQLSHVDVLVNGAIIAPPEKEQIVDGVEISFATNVLAPFQLMQGLTSLLTSTSEMRREESMMMVRRNGDTSLDSLQTHTKTNTDESVDDDSPCRIVNLTSSWGLPYIGIDEQNHMQTIDSSEAAKRRLNSSYHHRTRSLKNKSSHVSKSSFYGLSSQRRRSRKKSNIHAVRNRLSRSLISEWESSREFDSDKFQKTPDMQKLDEILQAYRHINQYENALLLFEAATEHESMETTFDILTTMKSVIESCYEDNKHPYLKKLADKCRQLWLLECLKLVKDENNVDTKAVIQLFGMAYSLMDTTDSENGDSVSTFFSIQSSDDNLEEESDDSSWYQLEEITPLSSIRTKHEKIEDVHGKEVENSVSSSSSSSSTSVDSDDSDEKLVINKHPPDTSTELHKVGSYTRRQRLLASYNAGRGDISSSSGAQGLDQFTVESEDTYALYPSIHGPLTTMALNKDNYSANEVFIHSMKALRLMTGEAANRMKKKNTNIAIHACDLGDVFDSPEMIEHPLVQAARARCPSFLSFDRRIAKMGVGPFYWDMFIKTQDCEYLSDEKAGQLVWRYCELLIEKQQLLSK